MLKSAPTVATGDHVDTAGFLRAVEPHLDHLATWFKNAVSATAPQGRQAAAGEEHAVPQDDERYPLRRMLGCVGTLLRLDARLRKPDRLDLRHRWKFSQKIVKLGLQGGHEGAVRDDPRLVVTIVEALRLVPLLLPGVSCASPISVADQVSSRDEPENLAG